MYVKYTRFIRENPNYLHERELENNPPPLPTARPIGYLTAYTLKTDHPKEHIKVKNLQLLCFKLATHKNKINELLNEYA